MTYHIDMKSYDVQQAATRLANAITPDSAEGHDATGGTVMSLTEAVMGITAGLVRIANAIEQLATAVECRQGSTDA